MSCLANRRGSGGGAQFGPQGEGITTFASKPTETVLSSELFAGSHTKHVEPRVTLNTGGAQDFYPALGQRRLLHKSQMTIYCRTQRRTPSVPCHPDNEMFSLRPPASPFHYCCDAHNLLLFALDLTQHLLCHACCIIPSNLRNQQLVTR